MAKNVINVNKNHEKYLYQIMNELELHKECIVENAGKTEWHSAFRKLGIRISNDFEDGLIEFWKTDKNKFNQQRLIRLPKDVIIEKKPGNNIDKFFFRRRKLI